MSEIVKPAFPSTEIIPSTKLEGLEEALSTLSAETSKLPALQVQAKNLLIETKEDYLIVAQLRTEARAIKKAGKNELGKYEDIVNRVKDWLKQKRLAHENAADIVDGICSGKMQDWDAKERRAAEAEQKRINEENWRKAVAEAEARRKVLQAQAEADRKQREKQIQEALKHNEIGKREAERERKWSEEKAQQDKLAAGIQAELDKQNVPEQRVLPNTPTIAGARRRMQWSFLLTDEDALLDAFRERMELRPFVQANLIEIGRMVRGTEDKAKAEAKCPGITVKGENKV